LPEEDNEAGELNKAEEVLSVEFPADEYAALPLYPGEETLDEPASHIAAQPSSILCRRLDAIGFARYYLDTFRSVTSAFAIAAIDAPVHNTEEVETLMTKLGGEGSAGLFVMSDTSMVVYRKTIYSLAERYRLPTIYPYRVFAAEGGLMSYGVDVADLLQGAASYIDRILRGEKPNELAVQQPTRFELIVNAKAAKMLGLTIPTSMIVAAQEVIE